MRSLQPCGTRAAYRRHKRHGETPCPPCREAMAALSRADRARRSGPVTPRALQPIPHGTDAGYNAHCRRKEPLCDECRKAHNKALRAYRARLIVCRDCGEERQRTVGGRCGRCYYRNRKRKGEVKSRKKST